MERDEVTCLLILAEELHFGRTAERMHLSRARVSQLVQRLERRVGAPLFHRTSRTVNLTELGRQLRDDLAPHQRAMDEALARAATTAATAARRSAGELRGVLNVGFSGPLAGEAVMRAAKVLAERWPGLRVEPCEVPLADPFGKLRAGAYDVQLAELPAGEADLVEGPELFSEPRVLAVQAAHPLARRGVASPEDLAGLGETPLLTLREGLPVLCREQLAPARTPAGRSVPPGLPVTSVQEALVLVAAGKGALLTGAHSGTYFPRPGVRYVPLPEAASLAYGLVRRRGPLTPQLQAFTEAMTETVRTGEPM
ncbi:LysR family transcriptional regulator [Streptomyces oryzae]|uniref:LysR family transcriptional regulator n=1 Tax=Streptomyces oryzae TaxID=1434886 RepID=A0ABS3X9Y7_9ACTN|nr:LysR family transcriptional regulator [Streptomyces oryzae]MBO8192182.1 LysR family transcriptional regulator [Streptomyces oryzae]